MYLMLDVEAVLALRSLQRRGRKNGHVHRARQYVAADSAGRNRQRVRLPKAHSFTKKLFGADRGMRKRILVLVVVVLPPSPNEKGTIYLRAGGVTKC